MLLVPKGRGRFELGGASLSSLVVVVDAKTMIVERVRGKTVFRQITELMTGARLHAAVALQGEGRARGIFLRVH